MTDTNIAQLEQRLELQKQKYKSETVFDVNKLKALQINNRGFVRPIQEFKQQTLGALIDELQELFQKGWSYTTTLPAMKNAYGWYQAYLNKPAEILESEYLAMDEKSAREYQESLAKDQTNLIQEIASLTVQIQEAVEAQKNQAKKQKAFEKALEQVKSELNSKKEDESQKGEVITEVAQ